MPAEVPEERLEADPETGALWIAHLLTRAGLAASSSEAVRLVDQGAVRVEGSVVADRDLRLPPGEYLVQRGKRRFARVCVVSPSP